MKKLFCILLILLITLFGAYLAVVPYAYDNRIKDPTADLIFENTPSIEEADLLFDYSSLQVANGSLLGRINLDLHLSEAKTGKVMLPFYGSLNNEVSSCHSRYGKNVEILLDQQPVDYKLTYGSTKMKQPLLNYDFNEIEENLYESIKDDEKFFVYTFQLNGERIGLDHWVLDKYPFFISNFKVITNLSRKEKAKLKNTKYENHALLEATSDIAYIISKINIDEYLTAIQDKTEIVGTEDLYKYFLQNYASVDLNLATSVAQNEYNELLESNGFHYINFDDLINQERLMVYEFTLAANTQSIAIKYNHIVGKDSKYEHPQYELDFQYNLNNYKNTKKFNVTYLLDSENKYVNFTILDLEKIENGYKFYSTALPEETKIFFSAAEEPVKSLNTLKIELAGFSKYIIIPVLFCILFIFIGIQLLNKKDLWIKKSIKEWIVVIKDKVIKYIPEILTFYLLGFKFYTLYVGDSSFNLINSIWVMVFLLSCFIYFVCKTMNSVNYFKLLFYGVLACIAGFLVQDVVFILLIALGVCFLEKGPKPYLRAMYIGIIYFSIQTILFAAYSVVPNPVFIIWKDGEFAYYRYALGFSHPNTVSLFLFVGCLCYILYKKPSWLSRIIMISLTIGVYYVTHSRTGCICVIILLLLDLLSDFVPLKGKWRYLGVGLFSLFTISTIYFVRIFGSTQDGLINQFLSQRPYIINHYLNQNWLTMKGMNQLADWLFIDNLFLNVLIFQGLPCYLIYLVIYTIASYKAIKSNHPKIFIGLIVYFIYSLFEATLMSYSCAIFIALLFITTLGDKFYMDGSLIERKPRIGRRNLYILRSASELVVDKTITNVVLILGKKKKEEFVDGTKVMYVTKLSIWKAIIELLKYFDPDEIHFFAPNGYASFVLLSNVFKGDLIVHKESNGKTKGKLYKKAVRVVEG